MTSYFQENEKDEEDIQWAEMFQEIEDFLSANNIKSNYRALGDMPLNGGQFLSCRCDRDGLGQYLTGLQLETHNPSGIPHVFESVSIASGPQIVRPVRKNESRVKFFYASLEKNRQELLDEFHNKFIKFSRTKGFYKITEKEINTVYGGFIEEVPITLKKIVSLGKELELLLKRSGDVIETMEEEDYAAFIETVADNMVRIRTLINHVHRLIEANPESPLHSSEGSVKIKDSSSEEGLAASPRTGTLRSPEIQKSSAKSSSPIGIAVDSSLEENSSFSEDFKHRSDEAEDSPKIPKGGVDEIQSKRLGPRK